MDFSLGRIRLACQKSHHSEIFKILSFSSQNEPFVVEAFNRSCSICINMYLWQINFDEEIIRDYLYVRQKRKDNLLLRIECFVENQEHIFTLLNAFREERFEKIKDLFYSNNFIVRNYAYQLALERELKEGKSDALLLLLQWEKKQLEQKFDKHRLFLEKSRYGGITSIAEIDPHFHVVSKLGEFMLGLDLSDTEPQQKKIKLDEKVPFISEIYEQLKLEESVIVKKWFVRKRPTYITFFKDNLESNLLQTYRKALKGYYTYFLVNYPAIMIDKFDICSGKNLLEYMLRTPDAGISAEILRMIVKAKPNIVNWVKEETGDSMLHVYVKTRTDSPELIRFMVEELGLDPFKENKAKENALESFIRAKWSEDGISKSFKGAKEMLEYFESKIPLDGAEFIQKFTIFSGFLMVYRAANDKSRDQQFFLQYAMEKFYGPELNQDYSMIERIEKFYDTHNDFYEYEVVALLHSDFDQDKSNQLKTNFETFIATKEWIWSFINGEKCGLIAKLFDESDEDLKLFFEISLPLFDKDSKTGFKKEHIERMIRVFNELISEKNNACVTIQEAIENWSVKNITKAFFKFYSKLRDQDSDQDLDQYSEEEEEIPLKEHKRLMRKIIRSGLFSALYSFTCDWKFKLRYQDDLSDHHYEKLKMFLGKSELFIPGSLYPQKGDVFSLKHLCRLEIRQMLIKDGHQDMTTYVETIESLGLPKKMENYIRYLPECCKNE